MEVNEGIGVSCLYPLDGLAGMQKVFWGKIQPYGTI